MATWDVPAEAHGEGIELMPTHFEGGRRGGGAKPGGVGQSPRIPAAYSHVVEVAPSETGYETDATAFSEGGFSDRTEKDEEDGSGGTSRNASETGSLLGRRRALGESAPHALG